MLTGEVTNHFTHVQAIRVCECFSNALVVDMFVGVHANYKPVTLVSPSTQESGEVVSELGAGAAEVVVLVDPVPPLLLIGGARILLGVVAWVICAHHSRFHSVGALEAGDNPSAQAGPILSR